MKRFWQYGAWLAVFQVILVFFAAPVFAQGTVNREKLILAFGDSLTAGYGLLPSQAFPAQLQAALRKNGAAVRVHNGGVSGDTSATGKGRLAWVLASLKTKPDLVILELGANDMLRGLSPVQTRSNLEAMMAELKRRGIPVLIAGMRASPNMGKSYQAQFDPIFPALARKHGAPIYPFFMAGVAAQKPLLLADGMHPNTKGVAVIVRGIYPLVAARVR